MRTTVGIVGGGPAGLLLARLLHRSGIDSVVLERRDRAHCEARQRAGTLEQGSVDILRACGAGARLAREGVRHRGIQLRFDRTRHSLDLAAQVGRHMTSYPQTKIVQDLIALHLVDGPPLLFEAEVHAVSGPDTPTPTVHFTHRGRRRTLVCDFVVGCDGYHGATRDCVPRSLARRHDKVFPYSWLGILADVPPSDPEVIYAHSPRGFALHSMRPPDRTRLYLQVPNGTDADDWPDERIWKELDERLAVDGGAWTLDRGPVLSRTVVPLRSSVFEPMRYGRVLLAGDAAHIVSPAGAKGINLALADATDLARAFADLKETGSAGRLDGYAARALERAWRVEEFSTWLTTTLHTAPDGTSFDERLQTARLRRILAVGTPGALDFAEHYTGLPLD
ncbi:4-hydroxybenzoate 3-monooxygenase [Streptomyces sp. TR1341]|uniref:4-hydroxybenzoate 3-monooxygenase n=1 Tax=Streptomyces sp. TR1341 TaxID=2601266 RepID=UPI00138AEE15|nr:4-hydroxybenzoate 3-monooxygenase [Streptomyces sp. TR1341]